MCCVTVATADILVHIYFHSHWPSLCPWLPPPRISLIVTYANNDETINFLLKSFASNASWDTPVIVFISIFILLLHSMLSLELVFRFSSRIAKKKKNSFEYEIWFSRLGKCPWIFRSTLRTRWLETPLEMQNAINFKFVNWNSNFGEFFLRFLFCFLCSSTRHTILPEKKNEKYFYVLGKAKGKQTFT